ncbi:hypothetical protein PMAYCL1PPCAC_31840, partial [Pristionchus mayeri]
DTGIRLLEDVVLGREFEVLSSEVEGDIGHRVHLMAVDHELAGVADFAASDRGLDLLDDVGGSGEEGRASVDDGGGGALGVRDSGDLDLSEVDSPVVLGGKRLPGDLSL